jgi:hypothetical protein
MNKTTRSPKVEQLLRKSNELDTKISNVLLAERILDLVNNPTQWPILRKDWDQLGMINWSVHYVTEAEEVYADKWIKIYMQKDFPLNRVEDDGVCIHCWYSVTTDLNKISLCDYRPQTDPLARILGYCDECLELLAMYPHEDGEVVTRSYENEPDFYIEVRNRYRNGVFQFKV